MASDDPSKPGACVPDEAERAPDVESMLARALGSRAPLAGPAPVEGPRVAPAPAGRPRGGTTRPRRPRRRGRGRLAVAVLGAAAVGAWIALGGADGGPRGGAGPEVEPTVPAGVPTSGAAAPVLDLLAVPDPTVRATCRAAPGLDRDGPAAVVCAPGGPVARLEYRTYPSAVALVARYDAVRRGLPAGSGEPACAVGRAEERTWSTPAAPDTVAGRYACRAGDGPDELWWTHDDLRVLGHAVATGGADAGDLFAWWRGHAERSG